jgi:5-methyltetrahydrofolate--homocysteine methyltransferase
MLIIGERINSTNPRIREMVRSRNSSSILKEVRDQLEAGANFIDVNCAVTSGDEIQDMDWIVSVIQSGIPDVNICIDSPNHLAIERAIAVHKGNGVLMINSITAEDRRIRDILPLAKAHNTKLVALTMGEDGMPCTAEERLKIARIIFDRVRSEGFDTRNLYFDALIRPISTEPAQGAEFLRSIPMIKTLGDVKMVCGLSNISFGLPDRSLINSVFLSMAMHAGLDAAILDPTDKRIFSSIKTSEALLGRDDYCADYIGAFRAGRLS